MNSSTTPLIFVGLFLIISSLVFLLNSSSAKSSKSKNEISPSRQQQQSPQSQVVSFSSISQQPISVNALDLRTIRIVSNNLESSLGYFRITLFNDENLQNPYTYNREYIVAVSFSQTEMNDGYTWSDIEPSMNPSTKYWLKIQETDMDDFGIKDLTKAVFLTPSNPSDDPVSLLDKIENILRNIIDIVGPFILQFVAGELLAMTLKSILNPDDPDGIARKLIEMTENFKEVVNKFRLSRISFLSKVNIRFKLFFDAVFRLTIDDIVRVVGRIGMYIPNTLKRLKITATELMERTALALRNMTLAQVRAAAESIAIRMARGAIQAGKSVAMSVLNPVDFALIAVAITGAVLDAENTGHMNDWNKFKTSDFLAMKEEALQAQMAYLRDELQIVFPQINGPLLKLSNDEIDKKMEKIELDIMFLPTLDSISDLHIRYIRALSPTGQIPETQAEIEEIENLQVMRDIRNLQDIAIRNYYTYYSTSAPTNPRKGWYTDAFARQFFIETFKTTANSEKLHRVSVYILCLLEGGTPLHDSQCSFKTPAECFGSYPWPFLNYSEDMIPYESPKPCSTTPCLDATNDFGVTDYVYSEWRTPELLKRDYPGGTDFTQDGAGGLCVVTPFGPRVACESATKRDPIRGIDTGQAYNPYTGECFNTKEYCDAFYVEYRDDMPTSEMANRGTGPLPSCFSVHEGTAMIIGGEILVQYLQAGFEAFVNGIENLFGIRDDEAARKREMQRISDENAISEQRGDTDQLADFMKGFGLDFLFADVITMVDFKVDKDGNMYVMYAKGINNGTLLLVKYNKFFEIDTSNKWGNIYNDYFFNGPVEKCFSSRIALDRNGDIYMIEFYTEYGKVKTKITKKFGRDGEYDETFFTKITSDSIGLFFIPGKILRQDNGSSADGPEINGIYIRNEKIYVSFVAYNENDNVNISKILRFSIDGLPEADLMTQDDFMFRTGPFANEEVFSFVVDDNERIITHFNTGTSQNICRFNKDGTNVIIQYPSDFVPPPNVPSNKSSYWMKFPKLAISLDNKLVFSNSLKVWKIQPYHTTQSNWEPSIDLTPYLPLEEPIFRSPPDDVTKLTTSTPNYWEVCNMDLDYDNNIHILAYRKKYLNLNFIGTRFIKNSITEDIVFPVKNVTFTQADLGIDFIKFTNINFVNCLGIENIEISITPLPIIKDSRYDYNNKTVDRLRTASTSGNLYYPPEPNKINFSPGVPYNISLKIDNKIVNSFSSTINNSSLSINDSPYTSTNTVGYCNSDPLQWGLQLDKNLAASGTRVLKWKIESAVGMSTTRGNFNYSISGNTIGETLTSTNFISDIYRGVTLSSPAGITDLVGGTTYTVKLYIEGFESTKFVNVSHVKYLPFICAA